MVWAMMKFVWVHDEYMMSLSPIFGSNYTQHLFLYFVYELKGVKIVCK